MYGSLRDFVDISFENGLEKIGKSHNRHLSLSSMLGGEAGFFKNRTFKKIDLNKIEESNDFTFDSKNDINKKAHTWAKSVTYNNEFYEVGPLSRAIINKKEFIKEIHKKYDDSVFTRVMARIDELGSLLNYSKELISKIDIREESYIKPTVDVKTLDGISAKAAVEACRGSLYHKIEVKKGKILNYDVITPTVWSLGPKNQKELGVAQKAIIGVNSLEQATIILRSFDVCSVCTTH